jgi:hypothetical protein
VQRDAAALSEEQGGGTFSSTWRTGKRLTLRHFEKMINKWARLLKYLETSVHQVQRQGISSDHVDGTAGGRREAP